MRTFTRPEAALEMIAACNPSVLTGMIERPRVPRPHRIDDELIHAFNLRPLPNAQRTEADRAQSNDGNDTQRPDKSLQLSGLRPRSSLAPPMPSSVVAASSAGQRTKRAHETLAASRSKRRWRGAHA